MVEFNPIFGWSFGGIFESIIMPIAGLVISVVLPTLGIKYVNTAKRQQQALELDLIADGILAMIRRNNPDLEMLNKIQWLEDQIFAGLLAAPAVTNSDIVLKRVAASAVMKVVDRVTG